MAAGVLQKPGTGNGPCAFKCNHTDCKETRKMAEKPCKFCKKKIGYNRPFYNDAAGLAHADCLEDYLDKGI